MASKEIKQWCDPFMFEAEEIDESTGPEVYLLAGNPDPLGSIAAAAKAYVGEFVGSLSEITDAERRHYLTEIQKTALAMPLESVQFHFRIKGVTRGFTHQMVRQRTAAYSQESTRFAVKSGVPVGRPPSLDGTLSRQEWRKKEWNEGFRPRPGLVGTDEEYGDRESDWLEGFRPRPGLVGTDEEYGDRESDWLAHEERYATDAQKDRFDWDDLMEHVKVFYNKVVDRGSMPAEDARGALPTNLLTQLNYITSLRGLQDHAGMRLCTQAQHEWKLVWAKILEAIANYGFKCKYANPDGWHESTWQFKELARIFKPVCFLEGKCPFNASFDRKCNIRDKVEQYASHGVPSSEWAMGRADLGIPPILPQEWTRADAAR